MAKSGGLAGALAYIDGVLTAVAAPEGSYEIIVTGDPWPGDWDDVDGADWQGSQEVHDDLNEPDWRQPEGLDGPDLRKPMPASDTPWKAGALCGTCLALAGLADDEARTAGCKSMFPPGNGTATRVLYATCIAAAMQSKASMKNWCTWNLCKP